MSWRSFAIALALCAGAGALAGCGFQPLYGGTTASGAKLAEVMAAVDINPIPGRVGQRVRNELIFENTGGGGAAPSLRAQCDIQAGQRRQRPDRADRHGRLAGAV